MSHVTGVVLIVGCSDELGYGKNPLAHIEQWLKIRDFPMLGEISEHASGSKHPEIMIYSAGYNHFPASQFFDYVSERGFGDYENYKKVLLYVSEEDRDVLVWRYERP